MAPVPDRAERLAAEPEPPAARPQAVAPAPAPEAVPAGAGAERLAGPAPPGRGAQAGRAATLLRLQVVLGNRAVQRLVQSPQAQAAPVPPVQRAEPGQEGAGGNAGAGSEAPVPAGEAGTGGSGGAGGTGGAPPAGASPEAAAQIAYAQAINQQVPPLSPEHTARLGAVIGDARVYGLIVERDSKKGQLQEWTTILQGHGTIPGKTVDELAGMAGDLAAEIKRLDGEIKEQLPALGVADEAQLAERVERQFPELFVARARQIALVILDQNQTDVLRESNRYVVSQSTATGAPPPEVDGLRQADRELVPLAAELRPLAERLKGMTQEANQNVSGEELTALETDVRAKRVALDTRLQAHGARYPILLRPDYNPGVYMDLPDEAVEQATGAATTRLLKNISDTRAGIEQDTIHVWDLNFVPELTYQSLNVPSGSPLRTAIARHAEGKRTAEALLSIALGVVAVGAGVALFSALGVGAAAVVLGAAAGGAGGSLYQLLKDVDSYLREEAAGDVALDPQLRDLSQKEPELLPIALDLVFVGLDAGAAARAARPLSGAAQELRAALAAGADTEPIRAFVDRASATIPRPQAEALAQRIAGARAVQEETARRIERQGAGAAGEAAGASASAAAGEAAAAGAAKPAAVSLERLLADPALGTDPWESHVDALLAMLQQIPDGQEALRVQQTYGVMILSRPGKSAELHHGIIYIGAEETTHAAVLHYIHEMNHALWAHLGLSAAQAKVMAGVSRQEFIEAMIREEAIGQGKTIRAKFDLMRVGDFTATAALEEEYLEAAAAVYRRERLRMPEDELRRQMEAAGEFAVFQAIMDGRASAGNLGVTHVQHYGSAWDSFHGIKK